jgi:hypothetical protein
MTPVRDSKGRFIPKQPQPKTILMRKADHEKWDAALRSGEYQQGKGRLETKDKKFCCLGVLQMALDGKVEMEYNSDGESVGSRGYPTNEWKEEHGVVFRDYNSNDELQSNPSYASAPYLNAFKASADVVNDSTRCDEQCNEIHLHNFVQIADAIKEMVEYTDEKGEK